MQTTAELAGLARAAEAPRRVVNVPSYGGIQSSARVLRVAAFVAVVVGALLIVAGVLDGVGVAHDSMRRTGAPVQVDRAIMAAVPQVCAGLGCAVVAAVLRLCAFVGLAVRDVARELHRRPA